jgi:hypothetical protein
MGFARRINFFLPINTERSAHAVTQSKPVEVPNTLHRLDGYSFQIKNEPKRIKG